MIQPYPYNDPFTQKIISCCFYWLFLIKTVISQILRFLVFRIHKDIEHKDNMTNSILLHMPEHSRDISIHSKPFYTIHDIEARLNPINKLNLIVLTLYYLLYSNILINRYVKPALRWYFSSNQFIFTNIILQKKVSSILYEC